MNNEGFWDYNAVDQIIPDLHSYKNLISDAEDDAFATFIALLYLHNACKDLKDEWVLLKRKIVNWLTSKGIDFEERVKIIHLT